MSRTTKASTTTLALLWLLVGADVIHLFGRPLPLEVLCWALSVLITASLLDGLVILNSAPGQFRAMRLGEEIGERKERRRHRCPTTTTTVPASRRAGATTG